MQTLSDPRLTQMLAHAARRAGASGLSAQRAVRLHGLDRLTIAEVLTVDPAGALPAFAERRLEKAVAEAVGVRWPVVELVG